MQKQQSSSPWVQENISNLATLNRVNICPQYRAVFGVTLRLVEETLAELKWVPRLTLEHITGRVFEYKICRYDFKFRPQVKPSGSLILLNRTLSSFSNFSAYYFPHWIAYDPIDNAKIN
jgi:hypothetical protein